MSDLIQLDNLSLDTLTELAKESFADCQDALQVYLDNEKKLQRFGSILKACREKVPHGQWQQWVLETFAGHLSIRAVQLWIAEAQEPEKRQKRLEHDREQKQKAKGPKAQDLALLSEQPSSAPPTPASPAKPERPAWLADPDEMGMPDVDAMPPLPKTNTHHTSANRRTPDVRETDRVGIVPPDDPRTYHDGYWYAWSEDRGRMVAVTDEEILRRADEIRGRAVVEPVKDTMPVVEHKTASVSHKPGKVPTAQQLGNVLRHRQYSDPFWTDAMVAAVERWIEYKQSLTGKAKIRSVQQWEVALTRMENVIAAKGWPAVADMIEKAIANGWQGWEHETNDRKARGMAGGRIYSQLEKAKVKYDPLPE